VNIKHTRIKSMKERFSYYNRKLQRKETLESEINKGGAIHLKVSLEEAERIHHMLYISKIRAHTDG